LTLPVNQRSQFPSLAPRGQSWPIIALQTEKIGLMDKFLSLLCEWLDSGEESRAMELLRSGPQNKVAEVLDLLCKCLDQNLNQCNYNPAFKSAFARVLQAVQVCL